MNSHRARGFHDTRRRRHEGAYLGAAQNSSPLEKIETLGISRVLTLLPSR